MKIAELQKEVHQLAKSKGWYDEGLIKSPLECHMLVVSEICEAVEEVRKGMPDIYQRVGNALVYPDGVWNEHIKPEGEAIELADAVIRILDYCEYQGINLEQAIKLKHEYNKSRPYRHGGKKY